MTVAQEELRERVKHHNVRALPVNPLVNDLWDEVAALSAQVVELQKERARDKVTHDLDLQGKMLEAAKAQVVELQNTIRNARTQREAAEAHVEALQKEIAGWKRYKQNIDEALNTGDGSYRP